MERVQIPSTSSLGSNVPGSNQNTQGVPRVSPECRPTFAGFALKALNEQRKIPENRTQVATTLLKDSFPLKLTERVSALFSWKAWMDDMPTRISLASTLSDNAVPTIASSMNHIHRQSHVLATTEDPGLLGKLLAKVDSLAQDMTKNYNRLSKMGERTATEVLKNGRRQTICLPTDANLVNHAKASMHSPKLEPSIVALAMGAPKDSREIDPPTTTGRGTGGRLGQVTSGRGAPNSPRNGSGRFTGSINTGGVAPGQDIRNEHPDPSRLPSAISNGRPNTRSSPGILVVQAPDSSSWPITQTNANLLECDCPTSLDGFTCMDCIRRMPPHCQETLHYTNGLMQDHQEECERAHSIFL
eukprot:gene33748-43612_t